MITKDKIIGILKNHTVGTVMKVVNDSDFDLVASEIMKELGSLRIAELPEITQRFIESKAKKRINITELNEVVFRLDDVKDIISTITVASKPVLKYKPVTYGVSLFIGNVRAATYTQDGLNTRGTPLIYGVKSALALPVEAAKLVNTRYATEEECKAVCEKIAEIYLRSLGL